MKIHLLPQVPKYFKTNLHTHSNISDGKLPPEEVIAAYHDAGYGILCLSDHNVICDHRDKTPEDMLLLTGVEININDDIYKPTAGFWGVTYHLNLIAKRPDNLWQPVTPPRKRETARAYEALVTSEGMEKVYDAEKINAMIRTANEKGFLVMYNHPVWSRQRYPDYMPLKGLWAMELRNTASIVSGFDENNPQIYADLLSVNNRLFPVGSDDAHSYNAMFGSWIMVGAEKLEYATVIDALEKGDFYMSCGPQIHALTLEDGFLDIHCSDAREILVETHARCARRAVAQDGQPLNHARIDLTSFFQRCQTDPQPQAHFRITIKAPDGSYAATRAYWVDQLPREATE